MQITHNQSRAMQDLQERLYKLYLIARSNNLIVADNIKDAAESLSVVVAENT